MTVKELIDELKKYNEDAVVTTCDLNNDDEEVFHFDRITASEQIETNRQIWVSLYFDTSK